MYLAERYGDELEEAREWRQRKRRMELLQLTLLDFISWSGTVTNYNERFQEISPKFEEFLRDAVEFNLSEYARIDRWYRDSTTFLVHTAHRPYATFDDARTWGVMLVGAMPPRRIELCGGDRSVLSTCPICLNEDIIRADMAVLRCCGNAFCEPCISRWSDRSSRCPMCRADLPR